MSATTQANHAHGSNREHEQEDAHKQMQTDQQQQTANALSMELTIVSEPVMLAHASVGIDWTAETIDAQSSLCCYSTAPLRSTVTVARSSTLIDLAPLIEEVYRIPASRQEFWLVARRSADKTLRAHTRWEPRGQHAGRSIDQIRLDVGWECDAPLIFLRDTHADPRPQPQETPRTVTGEQPLPPVSVFVPGGRERVGAGAGARKPHASSGGRGRAGRTGPLSPPVPSSPSASTSSASASAAAVAAASSTCPVPAPGSLVTNNSRLILFKFWDVPSQTMLYLGSAHFALTEPVHTIREYCAELMRTRSAEQTPTGELLRFSLSHLLDDDDEPISADRLCASHVWSCFEVDGANASRHFPFNFESRSRDSDAQHHTGSLGSASRFRVGLDWNTITTEQCRIQNGEMALFHLRYKPEQLQWLRQRYEQQRQEWSEELRARRALLHSIDASSQIASSPPATLHAPLRSFRSQFSETSVDVLAFLSNRVVVEFCAAPSPAAVAIASGSAASPVASTVILELTTTMTYRETIDALGRELGLDADRIQLLHPSNRDCDVAARTVPDEAQLIQTIGEMREQSDNRAHPLLQPRFFYSRMNYSWTDLETSVPVLIHYVDRQLSQTTFEAMISRTAVFQELTAIAVKTVTQLKAAAPAASAAADAESSAASPLAAPASLVVPPSLRLFAVDHLQTVRLLSLQGQVRELKNYSIDGQWTVHCMEDSEDEIENRAHPDPATKRVAWVRRYAPVASRWRSAGVPFTCLVKKGESAAEFCARLQRRLGFDAERMRSLQFAVLTQHGCYPIVTDAAQPWEFEDLRGAWACLGIHDSAAAATESAAAE